MVVILEGVQECGRLSLPWNKNITFRQQPQAQSGIVFSVRAKDVEIGAFINATIKELQRERARDEGICSRLMRTKGNGIFEEAQQRPVDAERILRVHPQRLSRCATRLA